MRYYCEAETVGICMGTVEVSSVRGELPKASAHIFTSQKGPWVEVGRDGLAWYERHNPQFQEELDRWAAGRKEA